MITPPTWEDTLDEGDDTRLYRVVKNNEEQYSIWLAELPIPEGWNDCGKTGSKAECLEYVASVWTDMRPLSVRQRMEGTG